MALVELLMPKMGESVMEGTILNWLKKVGDKVEQDESILEVATDKVDTEIPSTHAGVLKEILVKEGDVVQVGKPIAIIDTGGGSSEPIPSPEIEVIANQIAEISEKIQAQPVSGEGRFYSPLVLSIAKEEGISMAELEAIQGTGQEGRVTKNDILAYVEAKKLQKTTPQPQVSEVKKESIIETKPIVEVKISEPVQEIKPVETKKTSTPVPIYEGDEIVEMDRMRKIIAQRMVESKHTAPHVTSFVEADVTNLVYWRRKVKDEMLQREGEALTFMPMFVEAIVKALKDYPMMNISVDGDKIIKRKQINIGMAVALPNGNLIVPVIHNADQLNLVGLTKKINDLARRARDNKLKPDELAGGTYTVSNVGSFGNVLGTPIIMQPQVGILALGAIRKIPAVIETPFGDTIGVRHKMFLSHSYDHRVVDGALGGMFVRRVADYLEEFDLNKSLF
ncbi:dihydrolipoamide acetyltransferase family protein [Raineya orbicola]|uniref:Dihydrolipoamide acetyltransferase component of pyruvate dehydrogenase complex n=1 Tax=Raineya orbicola TaxID=2016530 RepID=A0A2N3IIG5_9BACT|nr:dihydrolipoamide acetyltransferase family protein [Raineya orbicola]PKQ70104.1 Pyruvate/2-oxoglutarate dehydrogenase complex dihydrolipoamide acyltransferase (E2) component [Raineya orbicola]